MKIKKDIEIIIDNKQGEVTILRELISLGLQRLEEVDKDAWGVTYDDYKFWGEEFLKKTTLGS